MSYGTDVTYCFAFSSQAMEKTGTSKSVADKSKKTTLNASQLSAVVLEITLEVEPLLAYHL